MLFQMHRQCSYLFVHIYFHPNPMPNQFKIVFCKTHGVYTFTDNYFHMSVTYAGLWLCPLPASLLFTGNDLRNQADASCDDEFGKVKLSA